VALFLGFPGVISGVDFVLGSAHCAATAVSGGENKGGESSGRHERPGDFSRLGVVVSSGPKFEARRAAGLPRPRYPSDAKRHNPPGYRSPLQRRKAELWAAVELWEVTFYQGPARHPADYRRGSAGTHYWRLWVAVCGRCDASRAGFERRFLACEWLVGHRATFHALTVETFGGTSPLERFPSPG